MSSTKEMGERKIIEIILKCLDPMPNMPVSFGDDVSAMDIGNNKLVVINTDMLVGKTDVPQGMSLWQAARKSVIMNISDLAAKGVQTTAILVSLGIPPNLSEMDIIQIGRGLNSGAREYNAYIIGGDTNEATDLTINCSALGICKKQNLIRRNGAKSGDYVAVTGFFGKTTAGLKILIQHLSMPGIKKTLVDSVLMPIARVKEGIALARSHTATSSIDSSDGLAWSLYELSKASNVGFYIDHLPVAPEVEKFAEIHNFDSLELALYGGEEYELLVTIQPKFWEKAQKAIEKVGGHLIKIGVTTKETDLLLNLGEKVVPINAVGWEHFKTN